MSMSTCPRCSRSCLTDNQVILHRVNAKGIPGVFVCTDCLTPEEKAKVDPISQDICETIRDSNLKKP